jgi:hypothetical protein
MNCVLETRSMTQSREFHVYVNRFEEESRDK